MQRHLKVAEIDVVPNLRYPKHMTLVHVQLLRGQGVGLGDGVGLGVGVGAGVAFGVGAAVGTGVGEGVGTSLTRWTAVAPFCSLATKSGSPATRPRTRLHGAHCGDERSAAVPLPL